VPASFPQVDMLPGAHSAGIANHGRRIGFMSVKLSLQLLLLLSAQLLSFSLPNNFPTEKNGATPFVRILPVRFTSRTNFVDVKPTYLVAATHKSVRIAVTL
jgi:hypothetical protein